MQYRTLGRTGVEVSNQCLGAMMFGAMGNTDHDECIAMIHTALDAGINFIDTADVYSQGESEEIVGKALRGRRDEVVLATKCFNPMGDDRNRRGGSRRWIVQAVEESLRRLGRPTTSTSTRCIGHDWSADLDETLGALTDLVRAGKVRYLGSSSYPAEWIVEAQWVAERRAARALRVRAAAVLDLRPIDRDVGAAHLPTPRHGRDPVEPARRRVADGQVQAGRRCAGRARGSRATRRGPAAPVVASTSTPTRARPWSSSSRRWPMQAGLSLTHLSLAFVDAHPAVTAPIIGVRTPQQLDDALGAADVALDGRHARRDRRDLQARQRRSEDGALRPQPGPRPDSPAPLIYRTRSGGERSPSTGVEGSSVRSSHRRAARRRSMRTRAAAYEQSARWFRALAEQVVDTAGGIGRSLPHGVLDGGAVRDVLDDVLGTTIRQSLRIAADLDRLAVGVESPRRVCRPVRHVRSPRTRPARTPGSPHRW